MSNYQYLSKSTVGSSLAYKKSPNKYGVAQPYTDNYEYMQRSTPPSSRKDWSTIDLSGVKRTNQNYKDLRQTFDGRTNNRFQQVIVKSGSYQREEPKSATVYAKKPSAPVNSTSAFDLERSAVYDRNYRKEDPISTYQPSRFEKTTKSPIADKKIDIDEKYKFYSEAVQKFKEQVEVTSKMSEELRKLKEDRKRRLEAKQKQKQTEAQIYREMLNKKQPEKQNEVFKKKTGYQYYSPKQEKPSTNFQKYLQEQAKTTNLDKYKSSKPAEEKKQSGKFEYSDLKSEITTFSAATSASKKTNLTSGEIKDFVLGKQLGQGKFGTVFQAFHKQTKSLYAIKKVPKDMIKSHLMVDQFCLEVKLQMFLNHENILTLFHFFDDKTHIYLVLEYMEEGTLFTHLKKNKKLPEAEVAVKVRQVASAVHYLHENQIAHRDIKPENIVMSHGTCKLCDFGWATVCDQRRKTYCGTFDYAPPEILAGAEYDYTVDLWCLGVLTYELLVGKAPFYHISRKETMKKILNVQKTVLEYPENLSKNAINFIDSLIRKDPKERLSSEQVLAHPFLSISPSMEIKRSF